MRKGKIQDIANLLRRDSLKMTSVAKSGHPTSCLSCAEIISSLFFDVMRYDVKNPNNSDNDEFILSKGHATPILYSALFRAGCIRNKLEDLRKINSSLEGHPIPSSLEWIKVATGSLGQGLGVGVGMALSAKMQKRKFRTYVLMGDSESAEGSVFEAMELASYYKLNNLIAIVDINRLGQRGETLLGHDIKKYKKRFEGFGWKIISIDGHNTSQISKAFRSARNSNKPTLILAKTFKGNGVSFLKDRTGWHGKALDESQLERALEEVPNPLMPKFKIKSPKKINYKSKSDKLGIDKYDLNEEVATRLAYGKTLSNLASSNENFIAIDSEVSNSTHSEEVKEKSPKQFVEAFIAEQNMISVALGLSKKGFNVFASTFSAFLTRAHDQIRMASISDANLTISGSHSGVSIGEDGASQMGIEDIALFRALNGSTIFYPSDSISTQNLTIRATELKGIKYIRTTRSKTQTLYKENEKFPIGDFKVLRKSGRDRAILVGSGITTHEALKAYEVLKKRGINVAVVDLYCIKPFNHIKFLRFVNGHGKKIILAEDHRVEGGIGEMISGGISVNKNLINLTHLAISKLPHSGKKEELLERHGIDWKGYLRAFEYKK